MTTRNTDNSLDEDSITLAEQLTGLVRGIRRSDDSFSLFFVESNLPKQSEAVVKTLTEEHKLNVLALNCHNIADKIFNSLHLDEWIAEQIATYNDSLTNDTATNKASTKVQAVVLIGLEQLFPISKHDDIPSIIIEMNWRRNFYRELALPIVLILPTFAIKELANYASDFYDWYSGVYTLIHSDSEVQHAVDSQITGMENRTLGIRNYLYVDTKAKKLQINQAKALLDDTNSLSDKAYIHNELGGLLETQKEYQSALSHYDNALKINQNIGDKEGECSVLSNLAGLYYAKKDYDKTLTYLKKSLQVSEYIVDKEGKGSILNNIGTLYYTKRDYATALGYFKQSLIISEEIGDKESEGSTLNNISQIYQAQGYYDIALTYLKKSLVIREEIGDKSGENTTLNNISHIYSTQGDYSTALIYLNKALMASESIGDKVAEGLTLHNISHIYSAQGDFATALTYFKKILVIREEGRNNSGMCYSYFNIGKTLEYMPSHPEHQQAQAYLDKSYNLATELGLQEILKHFN